MSETRPFLFGKLPAFGDFLCRGLTAEAQDIWDRRCTDTLVTTRARGGDAFDKILETTPPRGFVLEPGRGEAYWQVGCAAFSCDRVGRPFLFVLGVVGGRGLRDDGLWMAPSLERCLYDAFLRHRDTAEILDDAVNALANIPVKAETAFPPMREWQADWTS